MKAYRWIIRTSTGNLLGENREGFWHVCRWKSRDAAERVRQSFISHARYTVERVRLRAVLVEEESMNERNHTKHARALRRAVDEVARSIRCKPTSTRRL